MFVQAQLIVDDIPISDTRCRLPGCLTTARYGWVVGSTDVGGIIKRSRYLIGVSRCRIGCQQIRMTRGFMPPLPQTYRFSAFSSGDSSGIFALRFRIHGYSRRRRTSFCAGCGMPLAAVFQLHAETTTRCRPRRSGTRCCRRRFSPSAALWRTRDQFRNRLQSKLTPKISGGSSLRAKQTTDTLNR